MESFEWDGNQWVKYMLREFKVYDGENYSCRYWKMIDPNGDRRNFIRDSFVFNGTPYLNGELIHTIEEWDTANNSWKNYVKHEYHYLNSNQMSHYSYRWDEAMTIWNLSIYDSSVYSVNSELMEKWSFRDFGQGLVAQTKRTYVYYGSGAVDTMYTYNFSQNNYSLSSIHCFYPNSLGLDTLMTIYDIQNEDRVLTAGRRYTYSSVGDLESEVAMRYSNNEWQVLLEDIYQMNLNLKAEDCLPLPKTFGYPIFKDKLPFWSEHFTSGGTDSLTLGSRVVYHYSNLLLSSGNILDASDIHLFPNPAKHYLSIEFPESDKIESIQFYDLMGKPVVAKQSGFAKSLDISGLNSGIYILVLTMDSGNVYTQKFQKEE